MQISRARDEHQWESFLQGQPWSPFLQSWTMGEVYREVGEESVRLELRSEMRKCPSTELRTSSNAKMDSEIVGICQAIVVPAKRGKHLAVPYGPVINFQKEEVLHLLVEELKRIAKERGCAFIRMSPFWPCFDTRQHVIPSSPSVSEGVSRDSAGATQHDVSDFLLCFGFRPSPLHMLAEHIWYLDLRRKTEEDILKGMRPTTRNLIRRAEREGVAVEASDNPVRDLPLFLELYEETHRRHRFVPYPSDFIRAQVTTFSKLPATNYQLPARCALYLARYQGEVVATSIHMIYGGETSYHHGASTQKFAKVPASYLLQWRAIQHALRRGDRIYNFWGIAPLRSGGNSKSPTSALRASAGRQIPNPKHPFAGVTTFKTGFGGQLLELQHCMDLPLSKKYWLTFGIETLRKWRRGF